jgi:hypothetical protein
MELIIPVIFQLGAEGGWGTFSPYDFLSFPFFGESSSTYKWQQLNLVGFVSSVYYLVL